MSSLLENWFKQLVDSSELSPGDERAASLDAPGGAPPSSDTIGEEKNEVVTVPERMLLSIARQAMACEFEVLLNQFQYSRGPDLAVEALDLIQALELKLSIYLPRSELSILNRFGAERFVPLAPDTLTMLKLAQDLHGVTSGSFDVTAGSLSDAWGFSRRQGHLPDEIQIAAALENVGSQFLILDEQQSAGRLVKSGVSVNPGGIGKGYALDRATRLLLESEIDDFLLHGGLSSVCARGDRQHPQTGGGWLVSLRHPLRVEQLLGRIRLRNLALGTSGSGKQFFHFGGKRYSHIIDPRTGWPAQNMLSATVICPSAAIADALATAFFVMGPEACQNFCQAHQSISAILVFQDQKSDRIRIETLNLPADTWSPGG